jgi:hypothetical protein
MSPAHPSIPIECKQADKMDAIGRELGKLNKIVFEGNGQPSVMQQLATLRQSVQALCWVAGGTLIAVIGQLVTMLFKAAAGGAP